MAEKPVVDFDTYVASVLNSVFIVLQDSILGAIRVLTNDSVAGNLVTTRFESKASMKSWLTDMVSDANDNLKKRTVTTFVGAWLHSQGITNVETAVHYAEVLGFDAIDHNGVISTLDKAYDLKVAQLEASAKRSEVTRDTNGKTLEVLVARGEDTRSKISRMRSNGASEDALQAFIKAEAEAYSALVAVTA